MKNLHLYTKQQLLDKNLKLDRPRDENIIVGKFNIFHLGHSALIKPGVLNHIVLVGEDRLSLRASMVSAYRDYSNTDIMVWNSIDGYIPSIIYGSVRDACTVSCGEDRLADYERMCRDFEPTGMTFDVSPRITSSSAIIEAFTNYKQPSTLLNSAPWLNDLDMMNRIMMAYSAPQTGDSAQAISHHQV